MKLSQWAKQNGLSYRTAWRLFRSGQLPGTAVQLKTGTILVDEPGRGEEIGQVVVYARVSSRDQVTSLDSQVSRVCQWATHRNLKISQVVTDVASGMNGNRKKLLKLLQDPRVKCIVVEHRDRIARWGFEYIDATLKSMGRSILVVEEHEIQKDQNDLVRDMTEVLTSFCARLYGKRSSEARVKKLMRLLEKDHPDANHDTR